jgi:guanylate kinase
MWFYRQYNLKRLPIVSAVKMILREMKRRNKVDKKGLLLVISGPSGVGKGTINAALRRQNKDMDYSISATTRSPRPGETDGVDYFFLNKEDFQKRLAAGDFLEWADVFGNYYGTLKDRVAAKLSQGIDVILEIDTQGAAQVKEKMPDAVFIFIMPPSREILEKRLRGRGTEAPEVIARRLADSLQEMDRAKEYDYIVVNDDVAEATSKVAAIIEAERAKRMAKV